MSTKASSKKSTKTPKNDQTKKETKKTKFDPTQLKKDIRAVPVSEWDWDRLVYSEPMKKDIPDGSGKYTTVRIQYQYDDETIGPAIVELGRHYCFGVQPDNTDKDGNVLKDPNTGKDKPLKGYKVPIVMTSQRKDNPDPTDEEQIEVDFFDDWRNEVCRYSVENKQLIGKGTKSDAVIEDSVSKILYRKGENDGNIEEGVSPKLYEKLIWYSQKNEFGSVFYGPGDKEMIPLQLTGHFHITPTIKFDSIYISGKTISLQRNIYDATVEPISKTPKKRLARKNTMEEEEEVDSETFETDDVSGDVNQMMESDDE